MRRCPSCGARYRGSPATCPLDGATLVHLPDPLIGRMVGGRYRVEKRIGAGGMGTVYRARHEMLERDVAIKFLAPELAVDESHRTRFLREARAANRINHEHIIDITDFGDTGDGLVYLVMEYLDGVPLGRVIARGPLALERAMRIALQMAWALGRAHELDVVHRDVKPDNVYLLASHGGDFVKILDFGLAHMKGELRLTASGTVFGTPEYMAPEQARGMRATGATDLYALGCVLFEMVTGKLPFTGPTPNLILQHMREAPPRLASVVPGVPPPLDDLVAQLLEKDPAARPASAYEVATTLGSLLSQRSGLSQPPASDRETVGPEPSPRLSGIRWHERERQPEQGWAERVRALQEAESRAYPQGAPEWLRTAIAGLSARATTMAEMQRERDERLDAISKQEQELRELHLRIGRALDVLARDEAQAAAQMRESQGPLLEAQGRLAEAESELGALWNALPAAPTGERPATREGVTCARRLGAVATRWLEACDQLTELRRALDPWQRQCDDLRFQITQLKGRLASVSADGEYELQAAKAEAQAMDQEVTELLDTLTREAEPLVRHFLAFPELRALLLAAPGAGTPETAGA
jgi:eukaryotic-like serine/threonine-protein kinase